MAKQLSPWAQTAKDIRAALKASYPKTKFAVRSRVGCVNIRWTDGPTADAVKAITGRHEDIRRDEATGEILGGGNFFVFVRREYSVDALRQAGQEMADRYGVSALEVHETSCLGARFNTAEGDPVICPGTLRETLSERVFWELKDKCLYPVTQAVSSRSDRQSNPVQPAQMDSLGAGDVQGVEITINQEKNGIEIKFPASPSPELRQRMKRVAGFRWSNRQKIWYAKQTDAAWAFTRELQGAIAARSTTAEQPTVETPEQTAERLDCPVEEVSLDAEQLSLMSPPVPPVPPVDSQDATPVVLPPASAPIEVTAPPADLQDATPVEDGDRQTVMADEITATGSRGDAPVDAVLVDSETLLDSGASEDLIYAERLQDRTIALNLIAYDNALGLAQMAARGGMAAQMADELHQSIQCWNNIAETLDSAIDHCFSSRPTHTRRMRSIASSMVSDGMRLQEFQRMLRWLIQQARCVPEQVPIGLRRCRTRVLLKELFDQIKYLEYCRQHNTPKTPNGIGNDLFSREDDAWRKRCIRAGLTTPHRVGRAIEYLMQGCGVDPVALEREELRQELAAVTGQQIDGFFPTPPDVRDRMFREVDIAVDSSTLIAEPSVGRGDIYFEMKERYPGTSIDAYEVNYTLRELFERQGGELRAHDWTTSTRPYDLIIMNPPYEQAQDVKHTLHAWRLLRPGGQVISLVTPAYTYRETEHHQLLRALIDQHGRADSLGTPFANIPASAGTYRKTSVQVHLVVLTKPEVSPTWAPSGSFYEAPQQVESPDLTQVDDAEQAKQYDPIQWMI